MKKSSRHSKITGDFAEALVLYWLSKHGYECVRVDHTGIDLNARPPDGSELLGISVKCRSRYDGSEGNDVTLPHKGFDEARKACKAFGCVPYFAIVVDTTESVQCFLLSLSHLDSVAGVGSTKRFWRMTKRAVDQYERDPLIQRFDLQTRACSWREKDAKRGPVP